MKRDYVAMIVSRLGLTIGIVALDQQGQRGQCGVRSILEECQGQRIGGGNAVERG